MPSPLGHAIAGVTVAWVADSLHPGAARGAPDAERDGHTWRVSLWCALAAVVPDLDLLVGSHRTYSHSLGAVILAGLVAWAVAGRMKMPAVRTGIVVGAAYGSHLLLDWLGRDTLTNAGLMALWPLTSAFYMSGMDLFLDVSRRYWRPEEFILGNARTALRELLLLLPLAGVAWWGRRLREGSDG